ncbi:MAG: ATP-binding protein [Steroidobacteraceae bacterium]
MGKSSISRRLLLALCVPLLLFFGLASALLDSAFRDLSETQLRTELDAQMTSLISASDPDAIGRIAPQLQDSDSKLANPGSNVFAQIRDKRGEQLWRSPSTAGTFIDFGGMLQPGKEDVRFVDSGRQGRLAIMRRGLHWDDVDRDVTFSVASGLFDYERRITQFRRNLFGLFLGLTVALLTTLAVLMPRVLSPVRRLGAEIDAVEGGTRETLSDDYPRELAGLALSLNALLTSERKRIARYRDTLGNLAHSLKTPLAVMRASLAGAPPDATAMLTAEIGRMTDIVEHQLRRAATSGGITLGQAPVSLLPIAQELRVALLKVNARKDLSILLDIDAGYAFVGDRGDLMESLGNLMENACKWCRGTVRVQASLGGQLAGTVARELEVTVEDDGAGIAESDRARVLERGVRADEQVAGYGLGLAMVRDMVDLYGGALTLGTSSLGGARVGLLLPGRFAPP